jgi:surface carbohydrate biosynthesis protein
VTIAFDKASLLSEFDETLADLRKTDLRPVPRYEDIVKPPRTVHRILYLPIEVKARELASKVLIIREARKQGFNVVFGASWVMNEWMSHLPPGIVVFKSTNAIDAQNMAARVDEGHMTVVLDEEVYGIDVTRDFIKGTLHPHVAALADVVCAQGKTYADAFPYPANIHLTGNPRTLTYAPSNSDDILVCLQSGNINHSAINDYGFAHVVKSVLKLSAFPLSTPEGEKWADIFRSSIAHECELMPLMRETIAALGTAFPDRCVRVRPHPIENPAMWTFNQPNVVLDGAGGIVDALKTASALVFISGCTTGLDAFLAGVPAVRLGSGGHGISARMHVEVNAASEAVTAVRRAEKWNGNIDGHLEPPEFMGPIRKLYKKHQASGEPSIAHSLNFEPQPYQKQKFPDTAAAEIATLIGHPVQQVAWNTWYV